MLGLGDSGLAGYGLQVPQTTSGFRGDSENSGTLNRNRGLSESVVALV